MKKHSSRRLLHLVRLASRIVTYLEKRSGMRIESSTSLAMLLLHRKHQTVFSTYDEPKVMSAALVDMERTKAEALVLVRQRNYPA